MARRKDVRSIAEPWKLRVHGISTPDLPHPRSGACSRAWDPKTNPGMGKMNLLCPLEALSPQFSDLNCDMLRHVPFLHVKGSAVPKNQTENLWWCVMFGVFFGLCSQAELVASRVSRSPCHGWPTGGERPGTRLGHWCIYGEFPHGYEPMELTSWSWWMLIVNKRVF